MLTGKALIAEIDRTRTTPGEVAVWWMGQHSFIVKAGDTVIYIDPFLTPMPERQVPPLLRPEEVTNASIICGTHDHLDHIDRGAWPALAEASPGARFVLPALVRQSVAAEQGIPLDRLVGMDDGKSAEIEGVRITGVASAHEFLDRDPDSGMYPYLGYVLEANGCTLYHSGDSCIYEGMQARLRKWRLDAMLLPINGRDAKRLASGCIGNMTYQEAADLSGALAPRLTIPAHYEMFTENSADPHAFLDYMRVKYPALATALPEHGTKFVIRSEERPATP
jgi:L-ascorbate metabolism protein UlaG (beta-lactamase superfamily)